MQYTLKADNNVICQCGCIVNKYYMSKHFKTAKHELEMRDRICQCLKNFKKIVSLKNAKLKKYFFAV